MTGRRWLYDSDRDHPAITVLEDLASGNCEPADHEPRTWPIVFEPATVGASVTVTLDHVDRDYEDTCLRAVGNGLNCGLPEGHDEPCRWSA